MVTNIKSDLLDTVENSINLVVKNRFITKKQRMGTHMLMIKVCMKFLSNSFNLTKYQHDSLLQVCKLIEKNNTVFYSNLISKDEYDDNVFTLWAKLTKKLNYIINPKVEKAKQLDVHLLRTHMINLNNEN